MCPTIAHWTLEAKPGTSALLSIIWLERTSGRVEKMAGATAVHPVSHDSVLPYGSWFMEQSLDKTLVWVPASNSPAVVDSPYMELI